MQQELQRIAFNGLFLAFADAGQEDGTRLARVEGASLLARVLLMPAAHVEEISTTQVALLVVTCCGGMSW